MKCIECGHQTVSSHEYRELQVDLPYHVVVEDSPVETCPNCGAIYSGLTAPAQTLKALALRIAERPGRLHGSEVRFIRNAMNWSQEGLARLLGVAPETVSRWENGRKPIGHQSELAMRFLVLNGSKVAEQLDSEIGPPSKMGISHEDVLKAAD